MLISAFIFGILGSFHCVGMCGPIAFLLPVDRSNNLQKAHSDLYLSPWKDLFLFNNWLWVWPAGKQFITFRISAGTIHPNWGDHAYFHFDPMGSEKEQ